MNLPSDNGLDLHVKAWKKEYSSAIWKGPCDVSPVKSVVPVGARILDVGCGSGKILSPLARAGYRVAGVDVAREGLLMVRDGGGCLVEGDARCLPFKDCVFDAVVCYDVLQHLYVRERGRAVDEILRVLVLGGRVFVEGFGRRDMRYGGVEVEPHTFVRGSSIIYHYFSEAELVELFKAVDPVVDSRLTRKVFRGDEYFRHRLFATGTKK